MGAKPSTMVEWGAATRIGADVLEAFINMQIVLQKVSFQFSGFRLTCSPLTLIRWIPIQNAIARIVLCTSHCRFFLHPVNGVLVDSSNVIPIKVILETIHVKITIKRMQISLSGANVNDNIDTLITSVTDHESLLVNGSISCVSSCCSPTLSFLTSFVDFISMLLLTQLFEVFPH